MRIRLWVSLLAALIALVATAASAPAAMAAHAPPKPTPAPTIQEFPAPGSGAWYSTLGPDGNMWTVGGGEIVRTLSHAPYTSTTFTVPGDDHYITDITAGPDGNLWFTDGDPGGDRPGNIGRILSHAPYTITEFTVEPTGNPFPYQIVTGPDRNLYIASTCNNSGSEEPPCVGSIGGSVDRITPFGSDARIQASVRHVAETPSCTIDPTSPNPDRSCATRLTGITVGPDRRNLWLATAGYIDRVTLHGYHLTQYPVPGGKGAFQITAGPDKALWFTSGIYSNTIGRVPLRDPRKITTYPTSSEPIAITTGPDGNLWYTEPGTHTVATFSPFAPDKVTGYTVPSGATPFGIADGPCDNTVWFTSSNVVGSIQLPGRVKDQRTCHG